MATGRAHETLITGLARFRNIETAPHGDILLLPEDSASSKIVLLTPAD